MTTDIISPEKEKQYKETFEVFSAIALPKNMYIVYIPRKGPTLMVCKATTTRNKHHSTRFYSSSKLSPQDQISQAFTKLNYLEKRHSQLRRASANTTSIADLFFFKGLPRVKLTTDNISNPQPSTDYFRLSVRGNPTRQTVAVGLSSSHYDLDLFNYKLELLIAKWMATWQLKSNLQSYICLCIIRSELVNAYKALYGKDTD